MYFKLARVCTFPSSFGLLGLLARLGERLLFSQRCEHSLATDIQLSAILGKQWL